MFTWKGYEEYTGLQVGIMHSKIGVDLGLILYERKMRREGLLFLLEYATFWHVQIRELFTCQKISIWAQQRSDLVVIV